MALPILNEESDEAIKVHVVEPDLSGMQSAIKLIVDNTKPIKTSAAADVEAKMEEAAKQKTLLDLFREMRDGIKGIGEFKKESPKDWTALILGIGIGAIVALVAFFKEFWASTKLLVATVGQGGKAVWSSVKAVFSLIKGVGGFADDLLGNWPTKIIKAPFTAIKNAFTGESSVFKTIATKWDDAVVLFKESKFASWFDDAFKGIKDAFKGPKSVFARISTNWNNATTIFKESKFATWFSNAFQPIKNAFTGEASIFKTIGTKFATAKATFLETKFATSIDDAFRGVKGAFSGEASIFKTIGTKFATAKATFLETKFATAFNSAFNTVKNAFTGPKGILTTITNAVTGGGQAKINPRQFALTGKVQPLPGESMATKVANAGKQLRNFLVGPGDELGGALGRMMTNFRTAADNFKAKGIGAKFTTAFDDIGRAFTNLRGLFGMGGGGVPGAKLGFLGHIKNVIKWVGSIFNPIKNVVAGIVHSPVLKGVITFAKGFGSIIGKLVWPVTILMGVWDLVTGFMDAYKDTGSIWEGLKGGFMKAINTLIGLPLDMLWSGLTWLVEKFGFEKLADMMGKLDFQQIVKNIVAFPFDAISALVGWVKLLFSDPLGAFKKLWNGLFGGSGIITWIWDNTFGAVFGAIGRWFEKNVKLPDIGAMVMDLLPDNKAGRWLGKILGVLPDEDLKEAVSEGGQTLDTAKKAGLYDWDRAGASEIDRDRIEAGISTGLVQAPMIQGMLAHEDLRDEDVDWLKAQLKSLTTQPATNVAGGDVAGPDAATSALPQETAAGTSVEDTAKGKITWATGNMGTLYFNEAQMEKYKALEMATQATRQEAEQIKSAAQAKLKKELTAAGVFNGSAFFMDDDDPRKAKMLAREKKIEDDAAKMIQKSEDASLLFLNQMKRDTTQQEKLKTNWIDSRKAKPSETATGAEVADAAPAVDIAAVAAEQAAAAKKTGGGLGGGGQRYGMTTDVDKISKIKSELVDLKSKLANARPGTKQATKDSWKVLIAQKEAKLNAAMGVTPAADLGATQTIEGAASDATKSVTALSNQTFNQSSTTYAPQTANTNMYPTAQATDPHTVKQAQHTMY